MQLVHPAARSLRTLYALSSERLWFALAVALGLIVAAEMVEIILLYGIPDMNGVSL